MADTERPWDYFLGDDPDGESGAFSNDDLDPEITSQNIRDLTVTVRNRFDAGTLRTFVAGATLSALVPVYAVGGEVFAASSSNLSHIGRLVGLTRTAASAGDDIEVVLDGGSQQDASWSFTEGLVYLGTGGTLVQVAPASGYVQVVGTAVASDEIIVRIGVPVRRA